MVVDAVQMRLKAATKPPGATVVLGAVVIETCVIVARATNTSTPTTNLIRMSMIYVMSQAFNMSMPQRW